ncbi:polyketide cyclase/dehydrase and lipid transportsuperfamily protein [Striga asiatica]|uniref:Polyketide cyclase/dehydrase and lipid transportsuperfamily protein n=1 Tax=Striga asiatica TaxID=4170 RepID=A0A5A7NYN6_STRAF|nr:polyketide cyclase/dehydrase and lipid transportsuperfamily protein [Striga asiatica]
MEGHSKGELRGPTTDEVWPLLEDFFSLHKWLPTIDTCRPVEGTGDGHIRYCASRDGGGMRWCHERLVEMDPKDRWLSYEVVDNNMGFKQYKSTVRVNEAEAEEIWCTCTIEWSFSADPVQGFTCQDLLAYLDIGLQGMAKNMDIALDLGPPNLPTI